jgi:hypothetical protein
MAVRERLSFACAAVLLLRMLKQDRSGPRFRS